MARRAVAASFVLGSVALVLGQGVLSQGCTQDFGTFDTSGGGEPGTTTSSTPSSSSSGTPTSTSPSSSSGAADGGGGAGGDGGAGPAPASTGSGGTGGTGGAPQCEPGDSCDDGEPCTTDSCVDGSCVNDPIGAGTMEPGYVDDPEDCVIRECDGDGSGAEVADDDDDPPEEAEACAERVCDGMNIADGDPIREGMACGPDPLICTDGVCVGCDDETDCPTPPGACEVAICDDDGACGSELTDADPADGNLNDCRTPTCDGISANITFVADGAQTPADKPCGNGICTGMTPGFDDAGEGNACTVGTGVCDADGDNAACVACIDDSPTAADSGCSGQTLHCDDSGTPVCKRCIPDGTLPDLGCAAGTTVCDPDANAGSGGCVTCLQNGATAVGCTNPANDVCEEAAGAGTCFDVCYDDGNFEADGRDPGCATDALPACNEATQACQQCVTAANDSPDCRPNARGRDCRAGGVCGCDNQNDCMDSDFGDDCIANVCGCDNDDDCGGGTCDIPTNRCN